MQSEQINLLAEALSKAQGTMKNPVKNKTVTVRSKTGGTGYEFQYADLAAVLDVIRKPMSDNGLSYLQPLEQLPDNGKFRLRTLIIHTSGQWIDSLSPLLVQEAGSQSFGSALTFMRRYALCAMLGIAAEDDDDANAADGNQAVIKDKPKPKIVVPPPTNAAGRSLDDTR